MNFAGMNCAITKIQKVKCLLPIFLWDDQLANVVLTGAANNTSILLVLQVIVLVRRRPTPRLETQLDGDRVITDFVCDGQKQIIDRYRKNV